MLDDSRKFNKEGFLLTITNKFKILTKENVTLSILLFFSVFINLFMVGLFIVGSYLFHHLIKDKTVKKLYLLLLLTRILFLIIISNMVSFQFLENLYPDQVFYLETAHKIHENIVQDGIFLDYESIVGLHNWLYSFFGGIILLINKSNSLILGYRFFNLFTHSILIVLGYKYLYNTSATKRQLAVIVLSIMPSFLLFSVLILRELMLATVILLFFYSIKKNNIISFLSSIIISYYLRKQLIFIYTLIVILFFCYKFIVKNNKFFSFIAISILACVGLVLINKSDYSYFLTYLNFSEVFYFTKVLVTGLLSISFLFNQEALSVPVLKMLFVKLTTPEVFIIPIVYILQIKKMLINRIFCLFTLFILFYSFGYFIEYRFISTRYFLVLYPIMVCLILETYSDAKIDLFVEKLKFFWSNKIKLTYKDY